MDKPKFCKVDLVGKVFGRLTVLSRGSKTKNGHFKYNCKCECGNEKEIFGTSLIRELSTSCGCLCKEISKKLMQKIADDHIEKLVQGESTYRVYELHYRKSAEKRKHTWQLTMEQFRNITSKNCYWCGEPPRKLSYVANLKKKVRPETIERSWAFVNGIDRLDNKEGYTETNSVPCCPTCNKMKTNLKEETFLDQCKKIAAKFK